MTKNAKRPPRRTSREGPGKPPRMPHTVAQLRICTHFDPPRSVTFTGKIQKSGALGTSHFFVFIVKKCAPRTRPKSAKVSFRTVFRWDGALGRAPPGCLREASREHFSRKFQFVFRFWVRVQKMKHTQKRKNALGGPPGGTPEAPSPEHLCIGIQCGMTLWLTLGAFWERTFAR